MNAVSSSGATTIDKATSRWYKVGWPGGAGPSALKAVNAWGLPSVRRRSSISRDTLLAWRHVPVILTGVSPSTS